MGVVRFHSAAVARLAPLWSNGRPPSMPSYVLDLFHGSSWD